jgi:hypothetical protein
MSMILSAANGTIITWLASVLLPSMDEDLCWIANVFEGGLTEETLSEERQGCGRRMQQSCQLAKHCWFKMDGAYKLTETMLPSKVHM